MKSQTTLNSGSRIGPYEILHLIGAGGMGEVYRAHDSRLKRDVALKVIRTEQATTSDSLPRFQREARVVAALSHPNIVALYDFGQQGEITFAVMELLNGTTLREKLKNGPVGVHETIAYAIQIAKGLSAAHEKGIIHRDLKPENLFLSDEGHLKILDFGLARYNEERIDSSPEFASTHLLTEKGTLIGTFPYMSPEEIDGREVETRSDLFSFGIICYEMISGSRPFSGNTVPALLSAILRDRPKPLPFTEVPVELERIISRCLRKEPGERFASARELREALEALERQAPALVQRSVAVLPFSDMSPQKDQDYFCEGMAEEIINALVRLPELKVASRMSSFQFKNQTIDIREIGQKLGAATVLEGSVRKAGDRLRITAQLINTTDGYHVWSEKYDRQLDDVFQIQEEIAQAIVSALSIALAPAQKKALQKQRTDLGAYESYLRAKTFFNRESYRDMKFAIEMFEHAIQLDPSYAPAYAGLAIANCHLYSFWEHNQQTLKRTEEISETALQIDPASPEVQVARGYALSLQARHHEAERFFQTALQLDPGNFDACYHYARSLWRNGELEHALNVFNRAAEIRPEDYRIPALSGSIAGLLGRWEEQRDFAKRALEAVNNWIPLNPDDARAYYLGAGANAVLGNRERSLEWSARALASAPDDPSHLYNVACNYVLLGENALALETLEKAVDHGYAARDWVENDGDWAALRTDPRYIRILQKMPEA